MRLLPGLRRLVVALAILDGAAAVLVVAQAWGLVTTIVRIFDGSGGFVVPLAVLGGAMAGRAVLAGLQEWLTARASLRVRADLRRATLDAILRLGPVWSSRQEPGRLVSATGPGLDGLDGYVSRAVPAVVAAGVVPPAVLAAILWTDWRSGLILVAVLPLVPLFMALIGITTKRYVDGQYAALARLAGQFLDLLRGVTTLRVYGRARHAEDVLARSTDAYRRHTLATLKVAFLSGLVLDLLAALSVAVVAVEVGLRLAGGSVGFATALLVLLLAPELYAPLRAMGAQHHATQEGTAAAKAALDIIAAAPPVVSGVRPARPGRRLVLSGADVTYPGRDVPALRGVDLELRRGVTVLAGPSGGGKSTLIAALLGFVRPSSGRVIGAGDLDRIAWLPQRPRPSMPTVADEVRLGDPAASDEQVWAACRTCLAPDPATALGEDGAGVSAGQRRRIAMARALLRARGVRLHGGVPIVLLDEPSEDLDRDTERMVAAVIDDLRSWAIVVVATHSDVLAELADVKVTIEAGEVVDVRRQDPLRPVGFLPVRRTTPTPSRPVLRPAGASYRLRDLVRAAGAGRRLAAACLLSAAATLAGLGLTASSMWLIARAAQHPNVQALAVAVVGVRTFAVGRAGLRYLERLASHDTALRMLTSLRVRVFSALRSLPPAVLARYGRGDLLRRFVGDVDGAQEGLVRAVVPTTGAVAGAFGAVGIAAWLAPVAGIVLAGALLSAALLTVLARGAAGHAHLAVAAAGERDRLSATLLDSLGELVAFGAAGRVLARVGSADRRVQRAGRRPARVAALATMGIGLLTAAALTGVLLTAAAAVDGGRLGVVQVGVLAVCVLAGFEAVSTLPSAFVAWARCRDGLARVAEVVAQASDLPDPAVPSVVPDAPTGLAARQVAVAPAADAPAVVDGLTLDVEPGERVAIVGPSGCGKSTLLAAALRQLPVRAGSLAVTTPVARVDLAAVGADDAPPLVAGSLQGDHVFDVSLRDNLRIVRPAATDAELDAVAARVGMLEVIRALPSGWDTAAGPDGAALSGGQRQRLLLARALLHDPRVLVLDEPTAHLDHVTEQLVLADLLDATAGRTVLMSTHRRLAPDQIDRIEEIETAVTAR